MKDASLNPLLIANDMKSKILNSPDAVSASLRSASGSHAPASGRLPLTIPNGYDMVKCGVSMSALLRMRVRMWVYVEARPTQRIAYRNRFGPAGTYSVTPPQLYLISAPMNKANLYSHTKQPCVARLIGAISKLAVPIRRLDGPQLAHKRQMCAAIGHQR